MEKYNDSNNSRNRWITMGAKTETYFKITPNKKNFSLTLKEILIQRFVGSFCSEGHRVGLQTNGSGSVMVFLHNLFLHRLHNW